MWKRGRDSRRGIRSKPFWPRSGRGLYAKSNIPDRQKRGAADNRGGGDCAMSGITVLIVDDSSVMRKIVERALRQAGLILAKVVGGGSGCEGLEALGREPVGLVVSDINMPSMDGLEFLRQIQSQGLARGVPVVMITTESGEEHVREALAAGAQGYTRKPFTPDQVRERVLPLLVPA